MRNRHILFTLALVLLLGCRTEIDDKPAAEMVEGSPTAAPVEPAVRVAVDPEESRIEFIGAKITRQHVGEFHEFDGWVGYDAENRPVAVEFTIDLASLETDTKKLDGHLKTADFFDVENYPTATFTSSSIEPAAEGGGESGTTHTIAGSLDLHGVNREIRIPATVVESPEGVRATSEFTINRKDWNINYPGAPDDLIRDDVLIRLDLAFPKSPDAAATTEV
ncbi:MAG TPA: YceI family protein [Thermoanaerobaculia bacterium]|nr:YceI family protein [Thermoanaerobaculia bacterium]